MEREKTFFEKRVAPMLSWVGTIGAVLAAAAYIITVFILIYGFKAEALLQTTIFSVVTAMIGIVILQLLKYQGMTFAREIPENASLEKRFYAKKVKIEKKPKSMTYFWVTTGVKDVLIKGLSLAGTSIGLIYVVIEGSRDYKLILLAAENLILWVCFGLLSMKKAYDFYNNNQVPYMKLVLGEDIVNGVESSEKPLKEEAVQEAQKEENECLNLETKNSETCKSK